jgi:hypothetical protein
MRIRRHAFHIKARDVTLDIAVGTYSDDLDDRGRLTLVNGRLALVLFSSPLGEAAPSSQTERSVGRHGANRQFLAWNTIIINRPVPIWNVLDVSALQTRFERCLDIRFFER